MVYRPWMGKQTIHHTARYPSICHCVCMWGTIMYCRIVGVSEGSAMGIDRASDMAWDETAHNKKYSVGGLITDLHKNQTSLLTYLDSRKVCLECKSSPSVPNNTLLLQCVQSHFYRQLWKSSWTVAHNHIVSTSSFLVNFLISLIQICTSFCVFLSVCVRKWWQCFGVVCEHEITQGFRETI